MLSRFAVPRFSRPGPLHEWNAAKSILGEAMTARQHDPKLVPPWRPRKRVPGMNASEEDRNVSGDEPPIGDWLDSAIDGVRDVGVLCSHAQRADLTSASFLPEIEKRAAEMSISAAEVRHQLEATHDRRSRTIRDVERRLIDAQRAHLADTPPLELPGTVCPNDAISTGGPESSGHLPRGCDGSDAAAGVEPLVDQGALRSSTERHRGWLHLEGGVANAATAVRHIQDPLRPSMMGALDGAREAVSASLSEDQATFEVAIGLLDGIAHQSAVVQESVAIMARTADRSSAKLRWARRVTTRIGAALVEESNRRPTSTPRPIGDKLDAVLRSGVLRVAIDPNCGLCFRARPDDPVRGLDVDYALAFGNWLGVRVVFVEQDWDLCPELLEIGKNSNEPPADVMWNALVPHKSYTALAYSEPYTYVRLVLARRVGDLSIAGVNDLDGRVLGCFNDPAVFDALEAAGVRWSANAHVPGGRVELANLLTFKGGARCRDALVDRSVDAFACDLPAFHWAANGPTSPWHRRIELLPAALTRDPWYYAVGVQAVPESYRLLCAVNEFLLWFADKSERAAIEHRWQGEIVVGGRSYRDEPGPLRGAPELLSPRPTRRTSGTGLSHVQASQLGAAAPAATFPPVPSSWRDDVLAIASEVLTLRDPIDRAAEVLQRHGCTVVELLIANRDRSLLTRVYASSDALPTDVVVAVSSERSAEEAITKRITAIEDDYNASNGRPVLRASMPVIVEKEVRAVLRVCVTDREAFGAVSPLTVSIATQLGLWLLVSGRHEVQRESDAELARRAYFDNLTGLANRTQLLEALARSGPNLADGAMMLLDLDGFKHINDTHGHAAGDDVLRGAASRLTTCVRPGDIVARLGGDEFAVLLHRVTSPDEVTRIAQRIVEQLRFPVNWEDGTTLHVTASVGVALGAPGVEGPELLRAADEAMYEAKRAGKNRVRMHADQLGGDQRDAT